MGLKAARCREAERCEARALDLRGGGWQGGVVRRASPQAGGRCTTVRLMSVDVAERSDLLPIVIRLGLVTGRASKKLGTFCKHLRRLFTLPVSLPKAISIVREDAGDGLSRSHFSACGVLAACKAPVLALPPIPPHTHTPPPVQRHCLYATRFY